MEKSIEPTWAQTHQEMTSAKQSMTTKQTKQSNDDIQHEREKMFDILSMFAYHILRVFLPEN